MLGADSPADDDSRVAHVDFLLSRPALLGPAQAHAGSTSRRMVGREQDWIVSATDRNSPGMARFLPRSAPHAFRLSVSPGLGSLRSGEAGKMLAPRVLLDFWSGGRVRTPRRCRRC